MFERLFRLAEHGTSVRTEVLAGATTFLTMAYIVLVNPAILHDAGMPGAAVAAATCLAAGVGCLLMGLLANYPIALAPGMGLNAYFTYTVVKGMGVPWETALGCVFISGVAFVVLTVAGVRQLIVAAIPKPLFAAVAAGVGGATIVGSLAGTSTVVSYIESAAGVAVGGRTGLTAVVTGLFFLAALFVAPWVQAIPAAATAPALILVGGMMMSPLAEIDWDDPGVSIPAFLTLITIPLTFSIANGLSIGVTAFAAIRLVRGKAKPSDWLLYVLTALFIARFIYLATA